MYLRFCSSLVTMLYIFFKGVDGRYYFVVYLYYIHVHVYVSHFCDNMLSLLTLYKCMTGEQSRLHHINDVIISKFSTISISERKMALNVCECSWRDIYLVREQVEANCNKRKRAITKCTLSYRLCITTKRYTCIWHFEFYWYLLQWWSILFIQSQRKGSIRKQIS